MDEDVPDTRVFVSGLPPNLTSNQLGAHFAGRYQITDAMVVPGRRIGFVGFRNYTLAKSAVKYFDKTYIRMSKISVQLAKPVEISRDASFQAAPVSQKSARNHTEGGRETIPAGERTTLNAPDASKAGSFQPYVPTGIASASNKRKRSSDKKDGDKDSEEYVGVRKADRPSASWTNGEAGDGLVASVGHKKSIEHNGEIDSGDELSEKKDKKKKEKKDKKHGLDDSDKKVESEKTETTSAGKSEKKKVKKAKAENAMATTMSSSFDARGLDGILLDIEKKSHRNKKDKTKKVEELSAEEEMEVSVHDATPKEKKKRKKEKTTDGQKDSDELQGGLMSHDGIALQLDEDQADRGQPNDTKTDLDWLRTKTSRVLDLVQDDELDSQVKSQNPQIPKKEISTTDSEEDMETSDHHGLARSEVGIEDEVSNGRLFVRNLPYGATEAEIETLFATFGKMKEVHLVRDKTTSTSKGLAYVHYVEPEVATKVLKDLDGASFQGRLLHILPALDRRSQKLDEYEMSKMPLKKQKALKRKSEAASSFFRWNSLYMNPDAILSSVADRLGIDKAEILDPTSSDAAVKQAQAETHVIQETKTYLTSQGINIDAFANSVRDDRTLLVKNFNFNVGNEDIKALFEPYGNIGRLIFPPSGTIALLQYDESGSASQAIKHLAYRNVKGSVLYLEKGPQGLFEGKTQRHIKTGESSDTVQAAPTTSENVLHLSENPSSTVFVRNLNFSTTSTRLKEVFQPLDGFLSARVKTKIDPKRPNEVLSMGFGFVDFRTKNQAQAAMATMNGYKLDNHDLVIKISQKANDAAEERRQEDNAKKLEGQKTKIVIKNLPFEASKKDVRALFGGYGQLRSVRVPKKFDHSTRGFAFAEFVNVKEAENAIEALKNTHLLGRRLVLEFASGDSIDPEEEIRAMEKKISKQTTAINIDNLTGSGRRKFVIDAREEDL